MIIYYRNQFRPVIGPPEDNAPLIIDSDGVKARKPTSESLEMVAGRNSKVAEGACLIHLNQFSQRNS